MKNMLQQVKNRITLPESQLRKVYNKKESRIQIPFMSNPQCELKGKKKDVLVCRQKDLNVKRKILMEEVGQGVIEMDYITTFPKKRGNATYSVENKTLCSSGSRSIKCTVEDIQFPANGTPRNIYNAINKKVSQIVPKL